MKRLILCALLFMATGCGVVLRTPSAVAGQVRIGMSVAEFKKLAGQHAELDAMTVDHTVYRVNEMAGPEDDRYLARARFYRFDAKDRLVEVQTRDFTRPFFHDGPFFEPLIP